LRRLSLALAATLALVVVACGGDDDSDVDIEPTVVTATVTGEATTAAATTEPASETATPEVPTGGQSLPSVIISFTREGNSDISMNAEVADTVVERGIGLSNRESMPDDSGMLFVWDEDTENGFIMTNTFIPLTVAFIRADKTVIGFEDMEPQTNELHRTTEPFRYAVEANQGWFEENGVTEGATVDLGGVE
jgi:uncharacterized membrane protein (UPF0127 family)